MVCKILLHFAFFWKFLHDFAWLRAIKNTNYLLLELPSCVEVEFQNEIWAAVSAKFAKHCLAPVLCINTFVSFAWIDKKFEHLYRRRSISPQTYWKCIIDGAFVFNFGFILFSDICKKCSLVRWKYWDTISTSKKCYENWQNFFKFHLPILCILLFTVISYSLAIMHVSSIRCECMCIIFCRQVFFLTIRNE